MENIEKGIQNIRIATPPSIETRLESLKTEPYYFLKPVIESNKNLEELETMKVKYLDERFKNYPKDVDAYVGSKDMLQISSWKIVEAFLDIYLDNLDSAKFNIAESMAFVNHCVWKGLMDKDYKTGYDYLNKLTEHHLKLKRNDPDVDFEFPLYADLPPKGKAAVMSAKVACTGGVLYQNDIKLVEEIVAMDPEYWVWNYLLCKRLRCDRRGESWDSQPGNREREAIISAVRLSPPEYSKYCMASYCQCLAEILKYRSANRETRSEIVFGKESFADNDALYKFIKNESREIIEQSADGRPYFGECLRVAEIFSSILPSKPPGLRDYGLAERSFLKAEKIRPESSKLHHQFAKLYVNQRNETKACDQLKRAVSCNPANFPAWLLFVNTLHKSGRLETIDGITQEKMDDSDCSEVDLAHVLMVRGYCQFLRGKDEEGLKSLIASISTNPAGCERGLKYFKTYKKDYQSNVIGLKSISDLLRKKRALNKEEKELAEVISKFQLERPNSSYRR